MGVLNFDHGGNLSKAEKIYGKGLIDFSANINPLKIPKKLKKTLFSKFEQILNYPDPDSERLVGRIAEFWGIDKSNVLIGNGSAELIYLITCAYRPRTAIIPVPTFSEYERALRLVKSDITFLPLKEKNKFCFENSKIKCSHDICIICNPNNPTGNLLIKDREEFGIGPKKLLVIDEAFMDFLPDQEEHTLIREAARNKKMIVMRSFTKFFAIPGLRIGYVVADSRVIKKLKKSQPPWNVNSLAQMAAEQVLDDEEYVLKTYKLIEREREFLLKNLFRFDCLKCFESSANFILLKIVKEARRSRDLKTRLAKRGVLVRSAENFRGLNDKYIRIAVRSREENLKLIEALEKVL